MLKIGRGWVMVGLARKHLGLGALLVCALFIVPLLWGGFPLTHEADAYPLRLLGLCHAMAEGRWSGRWLCDFGWGFGSPFFNYYPPGFFYVAALFRLTGLSYADASRAAVALLSLVGSAGAYELGRRLWRSRSAGFITALIWTFFPYRILDLYIRGDFAELSAMSLMTWAMLGHLWLLRGGGRRALALAALAHGAIFWTHNISALIFQGFLLAFDAVMLLAEGRPTRRRVARLALAHLLALGLGAAVWMPALGEKNLVHIERMVQPGSSTDARQQLLWPRQLFTPGWDWGDALPGPNDQVSFQLGWATLAGLGLGLGGGIVWARRRRSRAPRRMLALALLALPALGLMLQPSLFFWEHVALARFIQFPWRLFTLAAPALALLAGPAAYLLEPLPRRYRLLTLLLLAVAVPALVWAWLVPLDWLRLNDDALADKLRREYVTTAACNEYMPAGVPYFQNLKGATVKPGSLFVGRGQALVVGLSRPLNGLVRRFGVAARTPVQITWAHFYFPGWHALVDGERLTPIPMTNGCMTLNLAPGKHVVEFFFTQTWRHVLAQSVSQLALGLLGFALLRPWLRRRFAASG